MSKVPAGLGVAPGGVSPRAAGSNPSSASGIPLDIYDVIMALDEDFAGREHQVSLLYVPAGVSIGWICTAGDAEWWMVWR